VDGETGLLVPPRDEHALMVAFKSLLDDTEMLKVMGTVARTRCFERFDARVVNKNVAQEYVNILKMEKKRIPAQ